MNSRLLIAGVVGAGWCLAAAVPLQSHAASSASKSLRASAKNVPKPNILIVYTDDMGIGDLSCLSSGWVKTPNLDRLASQGMVINNYYSAAPVSSPSRVGLTTGISPLQRKKDMMWNFGRNEFFAKEGPVNTSPHLAIRRGEWKLLANVDGTKVELYDMASDENETKNIAAANPAVVAELKAELFKWWDKRKTPNKIN